MYILFRKYTYLRSRLGLLLPEKYESIFDVSSKGPSSGSLVNFPTKLPNEGPLLETSKILSYFSGRSKPNLLAAKIFTKSLPTLAAVVQENIHTTLSYAV